MILKERVQSRLDALKKSPITLAKSVGLERTFIYQLANQKKGGAPRHVSHARMALVAKVLDCDVRFLTGEIAEPWPPNVTGEPAVAIPRTGAPGMLLAGTCETGVWRKAATLSSDRRLSILPDARFPATPQVLFEVRGPGMSAENIHEGMLVITVEYEHFVKNIRPLETGMVVVLRRERSDMNEVELSLRRVEIRGRSTFLCAAPIAPAHYEELEWEPDNQTAKVLAVVSIAFKRFML